MAIGNVTPDSFYAGSRLLRADREQVETAAILSWARKSLAEGADILDLGACSTRPNSTPVDEQTEWKRLEPAIDVLRTELPEARLSIDTFRPEIARRALAQFGRLIINDVSGGCDAMYAVVKKAGAPYIWTLRGDYRLPACHPEMNDIDLILDPGFGFIGSTERDYECMRRLDELREYGKPILVGISRKSMVYKPLGLTPETCLSATQALQLYAIEHGASIIRTHDVATTAQIITIGDRLNK